MGYVFCANRHSALLVLYSIVGIIEKKWKDPTLPPLCMFWKSLYSVNRARKGKLGHYAPGYHGNNKNKRSVSLQVHYGWSHWLMHSDNLHSAPNSVVFMRFLCIDFMLYSETRTIICVLFSFTHAIFFPIIAYNFCHLRQVCLSSQRQTM